MPYVLRLGILHDMRKTISGFTIVELIIAIAVIGILVSIAIIGYGAWQNRIAEDSLKSDLSMAASQLKNDLTWKNTYPATEAAANDNKGLPKSKGTTYEYSRIATNQYCLSAYSDREGVPSFHISSGSSTPEAGLCEGHEGPAIPGIGETWVAREVTPGNRSGMAYGNGKYVALGLDHALVSTDGQNWTRYDIPVTSLAMNVVFGDGKFVAISQNNRDVRVSTDGQSWSKFTMPAPGGSQRWRDVTYGNGKFVAVTDTGTTQIATSTDGQTWTAMAAPEANAWSDVEYCGGKFVAIASSGTNRAMVSADGVSWVSAAIPGTARSWSLLACGAGKIVALSSSGSEDAYVTTSTDGATWTTPTVLASGTRLQGAMAYGNGKFVIVPNGSKNVYISTNGTSWSRYSLPASIPTGNPQFFAVTYGGGRFVAVSTNTSWIVTSP